MRFFFEKPIQSWLLALALLLPVGGCGLFDDATAFTFCSEETRFQADAQNLIGIDETATLPAIPCDDALPCSVEGFSLGCEGGPFDCAVECGPETDGQRTCQVRTTLTVAQMVDLSQQVSNKTQASVLDKVSLSGVEYAVSENSLNFDIPPLEFYVGSGAATSVDDEGVVLFARSATISAGETFSARTLEPEESGQERMTELVKDYKTPFRVFVRTSTVFTNGQELPTGNIDMGLQVCFKAQLL